MTQSQVVKVRSPKGMAFVLMLGAFIGLFSETALNMALTNIMADFSINASAAQWLTTGYLLTLGILVPVSALILRWFTTRQLVIASFTFSIIGSIIAALAPSFAILLIGRIIQALGTGILLPLLMNVILLIFPIYKRGIVMGLMGLVITTAPAVGPTIAGLIVDSLGWAYIFWLSVILFIALGVFGVKQIDNVATITKPKIDVLSIVLSTIGFGGLIFSLSTIAEKSISAPEVWVTLVTGVIAIMLFVVRQFTMKIPMLNLAVFKQPMFTLGTLQLFIGMLLILSTAILLPLYVKGALLYSAALAGVILLPGSSINAILAPFIGKNFEKIGAKTLLTIGFALAFIGSILFIFSLKADAALWQVIGSHIVFFAGISFIIMPAQTNGLNQLPRQLYSDGSAVMNTLQQIAGAAGTAVAITLMVQGQKIFMSENPQSLPTEMIAAGTNHVFHYIAGIALIGFISTFFVKRVHVE
ncbi:DHA2 family efflux MFS transporter permease subunit [Kurthia sp. FSL E2-0154]|uniref:DHA2 family efflux MFS transporter permease subunit n=1 Tax=Kurthia sp. FSL E2-0154 TaxID=2921358 RepID=UPI0030FB070D